MNNTSVKLSKFGFILNSLFVVSFALFIMWLISRMWADGLFPLASAIGAIAIFLILTYIRRQFSPWKWLAVGIALSLLFTLYPLLYTLYLSITNMGSGHLMSKQQAISRLEQQLYLPEDGQTYGWVAFESDAGSYALWLTSEDGDGHLAIPGEPLSQPQSGEQGVGELDDDGIPLTIDGYQRLETSDVVRLITQLSQIDFGAGEDVVRVNSLREAAELVPKFLYNPAEDVIVDQETGVIYTPIEGTFTAETDEELAPGFITFIGTYHFERFLGNPGFREPLLSMLLWNIGFAFFSVAISFVVGLTVTILFDDLPGQRIIRALLIIPWPIPVLVSILIWRSMLNPDLGFVAPMLEAIFGSSPSWFQDKNWTRFAVIMINVWLSYPYFYVISAGAIRAIPSEIYDAAVVDGANGWNKFRHITLPLLLKILMPLLIASFTFNFNNFNVIYIFNYGNPPMAGTVVPMGHTDILISFVYRLAFVTSNVTNYGLAAAITVMLFVIVAIMVIFQIRFANLFGEVD